MIEIPNLDGGITTVMFCFSFLSRFPQGAFLLAFHDRVGHAIAAALRITLDKKRISRLSGLGCALVRVSWAAGSWMLRRRGGMRTTD